MWTWVAGEGSIHSVEESMLASVLPPPASAGAGRMMEIGGWIVVEPATAIS